MRIVPLIAALTTLGGCASSYREPAIPADHPASASAAESPPMVRSRTLEIAADKPAPPPPPPAVSIEKTAGGEPGPGGATPVRAGDAATVYTCPMHPEVTSDRPDQRCPKCKMKLKPSVGGAGGGGS
jgi:hypothetical protein